MPVFLIIREIQIILNHFDLKSGIPLRIDLPETRGAHLFPARSLLPQPALYHTRQRFDTVLLEEISGHTGTIDSNSGICRAKQS